MFSRMFAVKWHWAGIAGAVLIAAGFSALDVVPAASQDASLRSWQVEATEDYMDPWSDAWDKVRASTVSLTGQNATKPLGGGEVATLKARSIHDGDTLYIVVEWRDKTVDDAVNGHNIFTDSAAIEFPATAGISIPSFCMGDANGTVNIWHWKAAWQRDMDSGFSGVRDRYPDGFADEYSWATGSLYFPARDVGNPLAQTEHETPVENLVAGSFGTLTPADVQDVDGAGAWRDGRWRVVFARELQAGPGLASMDVGDSTNLAFAVWDGARGHRDGIKSVSQFMNLQLSASMLPEQETGFPWWGWAILIGIGLTVAAGLSATQLARRDRGA